LANADVEERAKTTTLLFLQLANPKSGTQNRAGTGENAWGIRMERLVSWWCFLIGVTDKSAIHVAEGVVAAFLLLAIPLLIFGLLRYRR
jgi:hypothetical protein